MKTSALSLVMVLLSTLFLSALLSTIVSATGDPNAWTVDDDGQADFRTIQEAINAATDGDNIEVNSGIYREDLNITKHISIQGQNPESTIIQGGITIWTSGVTIDSLKLLGFGRWKQLKTFENGYGVKTLSGVPYTPGNLQETWGTIISNCIFENWILPISLMSGDGERVINNTILNCDVGVDVGTFNNVIGYNKISGCDNGIMIGGLTGNQLVGNDISGAKEGVVINWYCHDNEVIGNTISNCQEGIHLGVPPPENYGPCSDNVIYHNNLIGNLKQVFLGNGSLDLWDNGYPSGGNYWSDYNGKDADNDGIGDTPYIIDENNKDRYPLMTPSTVIDPIPTPSLPPDSQNVTILEVSCFSSSSLASFSVEINGSLTWNGTGLSNCSILLSVSDDSGISWSNITIVNTNSKGKFEALWTPKTTGSYLLRSIWAGNSEYGGANATISFAVTPFEEVSVFSVSSNSTISDFFFDSISKTLSFSVTGPSGTTGYVYVCIPKTILTNISDLHVYLDDTMLPFTVEELLDAWYVSFNYHHSTHQIKVSLDYSSIDTPSQPLQITFEMLLILGLIIVALLIFATALFLVVKKPDNKILS